MNYPSYFTPARRQPAKRGRLLLILAAVVLALAIITSFIPLSRSGSGGPEVNFAAQRASDTIAFKMAQLPGAKYSGSFTYGGKKYNSTSDPGTERTWKFTDLVVSASGNAAGTLEYDGNRAQYRVLANFTFVNASTAFWKSLLPNQSEGLDWANINNKWVASRDAGVPNLGALLSPQNLGLRLVSPSVGTASAPGPEVVPGEAKLPDTRYWPTRVPQVKLSDDSFTIDELTTTFDPETQNVTKVAGLYRNYVESAKISLAVEYVDRTAIDKVFTSGRALAPELAEVPVVAAKPTIEQPAARQIGNCASTACTYEIQVGGTLSNAEAAITGYSNFGVKSLFRDRSGSTFPSDCDRVIRVPLNKFAKYRCTVRGISAKTAAPPTFKGTTFLVFAIYSTDMLTEGVDANQSASSATPRPVRTGSKTAGPVEKYNFQVTAMPSTIGVRVGDYVFDGFSPSGKLYIARSAGYSEHVKAEQFDKTWAGYSVLVRQGKEQLAAAKYRPIIWYVAEPDAVQAFRNLIKAEGLSLISVYDVPAT
ncbi:hypothetical protein [Gordonia sp. CPCC 205333]|uniref:hypothetical protein n=1 Tax=Gordonia sp. CPCC 205333 TaxID=3140790 RepID=UPI003AF3F1EB